VATSKELDERIGHNIGSPTSADAYETRSSAQSWYATSSVHDTSTSTPLRCLTPANRVTARERDMDRPPGTCERLRTDLRWMLGTVPDRSGKIDDLVVPYLVGFTRCSSLPIALHANGIVVINHDSIGRQRESVCLGGEAILSEMGS
jgi:hypothetical protein